MKISTAIVDYFRKGPVLDKSEAVDFAEINKLAVQRGWLIHPECCNNLVKTWLGTLTTNYNATFYKEWHDVISKSRFELFIDQIMHYATTYGKLIAGEEPDGNGYVPNDGAVTPQFKDLKVLQPISLAELADACLNVLKSGIALKEKTMRDICDFWVSSVTPDTDSDATAQVLSEIKSKEAQVYLSDKLNILPADEFGMLRLLVYKYAGSTMLIKSKATIALVKAAARAFSSKSRKSPLLSLTDKQMHRLARIFYRFKPLFLAMKSKATAHVINTLRRYAMKDHKPFETGFWESIVANPHSYTIADVEKRLKDLDAWRKIRLMMITRQKMMFEQKSGVYVIRNGKMYVREGYKPGYSKRWIQQLYFALEASLVEGLKSKACVVKFPQTCSIALPTSEKNFVGNYPYGTSFDLTKNNVLGVYWRNEWGTRDYDLSMINISGEKIGWNAAYYSGWGRGMSGGSRSQVIYSGDMTNANPEAVELLYIEATAPDGIVKLNKFNGEDDSKFRFFFANEHIAHDKCYGHMVDPNNIKFDTMIDFQGQGEKTIGMLLGGKFIMMDMGTGTRRVSTSGKYVNTVIESMKQKAQCFIPLKEILLRAGFTEWEPPKEGEEEKPEDVLDLTNPEKDSLIKLFM